MNKIKFMAFLILTSVLVMSTISIVSAQNIWSFDNFFNNYKKYGSTTCNVQGTKACRNELSWMGNSIKFKFRLESTEGLSETLKFNFNVVYYTNYGKDRDAILDISYGKGSTTLIVDGTGTYEVSIPKGFLKAGNNFIQIKGKNINVGYGRHPPTVVFDYVSLENS